MSYGLHECLHRSVQILNVPNFRPFRHKPPETDFYSFLGYAKKHQRFYCRYSTPHPAVGCKYIHLASCPEKRRRVCKLSVPILNLSCSKQVESTVSLALRGKTCRIRYSTLRRWGHSLSKLVQVLLSVAVLVDFVPKKSFRNPPSTF